MTKIKKNGKDGYMNGNERRSLELINQSPKSKLEQWNIHVSVKMYKMHFVLSRTHSFIHTHILRVHTRLFTLELNNNNRSR